MLPKHLEPRLNKWSAYAELAGYVASVSLKVLALQLLNESVGRFEDTMSRVSMVRSLHLVCARASTLA